MAFKHSISLLLIGYKLWLLSIPILVAVYVLFDRNLSSSPSLDQFVDLDLLLSTGFTLEHVVLFL